jgi:TolA-binding protein
MAVAPKLQALGRAVAGVGNAAVEARARQRPPVEERLAAIHAELARRGQARGGESLRAPVAIGLALGTAVAAVILWPTRDPALTFAVGEPTIPGQSGAWLVAPEQQTLPIDFSDGTRLRLESSARVRILDVGPHGARVGIERGTLRADVVPRAGNAWSVVGGPFEIRVTGTSFDAGWDPDTEVLRVTLREGHVVVRAACLDRERALVAGDAVALSCARAGGSAPAPAPLHTETEVVPSARASSAVARWPLAPSAPAETPPLETTAFAASAASAASSAAPRASWRELSRAGDNKGALAAAEAEGWSALCAGLSAADLLELGTIARLAGHRGRAVEAYSAVRRRFSGSDAAASAAFHLGQLAFDGARAYAEAHRWFAAYLAERPAGALAGEALGRTMEAEQRLGDLPAARETARRYLARYPTGAHADLASSLVAP